MQQFEWDDEKNRLNIKNHKVSFESASTVFLDPFHLIAENDSFDFEQRYSAVGKTIDGEAVLLVIHVYRDYDDEQEVIRIISARKLSQGEVKYYGYN